MLVDRAERSTSPTSARRIWFQLFPYRRISRYSLHAAQERRGKTDTAREDRVAVIRERSTAPDVFISYSRADRAFAQHLTERLESRGRTAWVDWIDIPPSAEWMAEIQRAIEAVDAFVFVISPDSVGSRVCSQELAHAVSSNKRIVPVLHREVEGSVVPDAAAQLNWILFRESEDQDRAIQDLMSALDTDLDHVRRHSRLLVRAREWLDRNQDRSLFLRGTDLRDAESMLTSQIEPRATALQSQFVVASRKAASRRQRAGIGAITVALVLSIALTIFAVAQRVDAQRQRDLARRQRAIAQSRELASQAMSQLDQDPERGLLLAVEAARRASTSQATDALRRALTESRVRIRLEGHRGPVLEVAFSSDGTRLVTAGSDGTARVWAADDKARPLVLRGHKDAVESASFNSDGSLIVTASVDGTARVWDASSGAALWTLADHMGPVYAAMFSPDGRTIVTAGGDAIVRTWDTRTGRLLRMLAGHGRPVYYAAFSADGTRIVTASDDNTARIWDAHTGGLLHTLRGHSDGLYAASFSPDGARVVTASEDGTAKVWMAASGRLIADLRGSKGAIPAASFSPDGRRVVTASEDGTARIWDARSGRQQLVLRGHEDEVNTARFSSDGKLVVTASADGTARVWDAGTGSVFAVLRGHIGEVLSASLAPDGRSLATAGADGTARIWDALGGGARFEGHSGPVNGVAFDPQGDQVVSAGDDGTVRIWRAATGEQLVKIEAGAPQLEAEFIRDGSQVVASGVDGVLHIWDARDGRIVHELTGHDPAPTFFWFTRDKRRIISWGFDGTVRLWDVNSGQQQVVLKGHVGPAFNAVSTPDDKRIVTTGLDGTVRLWDAESGRQLWLSRGHAGAAGFVDASPDGRLIATAGNDATVRLWDARSGRPIRVLTGHAGGVHGVWFSPDGHRLLSWSEDGSARIWQVETGRQLLLLQASDKNISWAEFSSDGVKALTASDDGIVRIWDVATGTLVATYRGHTGAVYAGRFSPDGKTILSAGIDGLPRLDRCDACGSLRQLLSLARNRATRNLTSSERAEFLHQGSHGRASRSNAPGTALVDDKGRLVPDGVLSPGRYSQVRPGGSISFAVDQGWSATTFPTQVEVRSAQATGVQLLRAELPSNGLSIMMLQPGRVVDPGKDWDEDRNVLPFPENFPAWLSHHPNLNTVSSAPTTIAGLSGTQVDTIVASVPERNPWPPCGGCVPLIPYTLANESGPLTTSDPVNALGPGEYDRWIVLRSGDRLFLINFFGASKQDFASFVPLVDRVLSTLRLQIGS